MKSRISSRIGSLLLGTLLGAGVAGSALAQSGGNAEGLLNNSWVFNLGGFVYQTSLEARLDGQSSQNPEIDFDETFGKAEDSTRVRADVLWRITPAHHLRFMYFDNSNSRTRVLGEDIQWGDYTFLNRTAARRSSRSSTSMRCRTSGRSCAVPLTNVAASFGVHFMDMKFAALGQRQLHGPRLRHAALLDDRRHQGQ